MYKKKVLILGGAGYIGGYTTDYLTSKNYDVTVYDNLVYENLYLKPVNFINGDIRDTEKVLSLAKDFDVIVIMAALVGDAACAVDPILSDEINRASVEKICNGIDKSKHIIFMSTCSVYGAQNELLTEESDPNPLSVYASTKLAAEKYISDVRGTIFRLGTVYGVGDTYSRLRLDLVVNVLTMKSVYDNKITIFGGEQWRPLICVKDIAGFIHESIERDIRGTYIISEGNYKMSDLGTTMKTIFPEIELIYTDIKFEDARNYKVSNKKLTDTFIYTPQHDITKEVKELELIFKAGRVANVNDSVYDCGRFLKTNIYKL